MAWGKISSFAVYAADNVYSKIPVFRFLMDRLVDFNVFCPVTGVSGIEDKINGSCNCHETKKAAEPF